MLFFRRFGPCDEVSAERSFIAQALELELEQRPSVQHALADASDVRAGMMLCRRRLQLECRVAELEMRLERTDKTRGVVGGHEYDDTEWKNVRATAETMCKKSDQPRIDMHQSATVSVLPRNLMRELELTIHALHTELEARGREKDLLKRVVDANGLGCLLTGDAPPVSVLSVLAPDDRDQSCVDARIEVNCRNNLLRYCLHAWNQIVRGQRKAMRYVLRCSSKKYARFFRAWHNHVTVANVQRQINAGGGVVINGSLSNRLRLLFKSKVRSALRLVLQVWASLPGLQACRLSAQLMIRFLMRSVQAWAWCAIVLRRHHLIVGRFQTTASRRSIARVVRQWRALIAQDKLLVRNLNRFNRISLQFFETQMKAYFWGWLFNANQPKRKLRMFQFSDTARCCKLRGFVGRWLAILLLQKSRRLNGNRISFRYSRKQTQAHFGEWSSNRAHQRDQKHFASRSADAARCRKLRGIVGGWISILLQKKSRRLNATRMRRHFRFRLLTIIMQSWRQAVQYLVAVQQYWRVASEIGKIKGTEPTLGAGVQTWSRHCRWTAVLLSWRPAVHYLFADKQYRRVSSQVLEAWASHTRLRARRIVSEYQLRRLLRLILQWCDHAFAWRRVRLSSIRCQNKIARGVIFRCLRIWIDIVGEIEMYTHHLRRGEIRFCWRHMRQAFYRWTHVWSARWRQLDTAISCIQISERSYSRRKKEKFILWASFCLLQRLTRIAKFRLERKCRTSCQSLAMLVWSGLLKHMLHNRKRLLANQLKINSALSAFQKEHDPCRFAFEEWNALNHSIGMTIEFSSAVDCVSGSWDDPFWKDALVDQLKQDFISSLHVHPSSISAMFYFTHNNVVQVIFSPGSEKCCEPEDDSCDVITSEVELEVHEVWFDAVETTNALCPKDFCIQLAEQIYDSSSKLHTKVLGRFVQRAQLHGLVPREIVRGLQAFYSTGQARDGARKMSMHDHATSLLVRISAKITKARIRKLLRRWNWWRLAKSQLRFLQSRGRENSERALKRRSLMCLLICARYQRRLLSRLARISCMMTGSKIRKAFRRWTKFRTALGHLCVSFVRCNELSTRRLVRSTWIGLCVFVCWMRVLSARFYRARESSRIRRMQSTLISLQFYVHCKRELASRSARCRVCWQTRRMHSALVDLRMYVGWRRGLASQLARCKKTSRARRMRIILAHLRMYVSCKHGVTHRLAQSKEAYKKRRQLQLLVVWCGCACKWRIVRLSLIRCQNKISLILMTTKREFFDSVFRAWALHAQLRACRSSFELQRRRLLQLVLQWCGHACFCRRVRVSSIRCQSKIARGVMVQCLNKWIGVVGDIKMHSHHLKRSEIRMCWRHMRRAFYRWMNVWSLRRRQLDTAISCLQISQRSCNKQKKDCVLTWVSFCLLQKHTRIAEFRIKRTCRTSCLSISILMWSGLVNDMLHDREGLLTKHLKINSALSKFQKEHDPCRFAFEEWSALKHVVCYAKRILKRCTFVNMWCRMQQKRLIASASRHISNQYTCVLQYTTMKALASYVQRRRKSKEYLRTLGRTDARMRFALAWCAWLGYFKHRIHLVRSANLGACRRKCESNSQLVLQILRRWTQVTRLLGWARRRQKLACAVSNVSIVKHAFYEWRAHYFLTRRIGGSIQNVVEKKLVRESGDVLRCWCQVARRNLSWQRRTRRVVERKAYKDVHDVFFNWCHCVRQRWRHKRLVKFKSKSDLRSALRCMIRRWRSTMSIQSALRRRIHHRLALLCIMCFRSWRGEVWSLHKNSPFVRRIVRRCKFVVYKISFSNWHHVHRLRNRVRGVVQHAVEKKLQNETAKILYYWMQISRARQMFQKKYSTAIKRLIHCTSALHFVTWKENFRLRCWFKNRLALLTSGQQSRVLYTSVNSWQRRFLKNRFLLRQKTILVSRLVRRTIALTLDEWSRICEQKKQISAYKSLSANACVSKWTNGMIQMLKIEHIKKRYVFSLWRSVMTEKDADESVALNYPLIYVTKVWIFWKSLYNVVKLYRKARLCSISTINVVVASMNHALRQKILLCWSTAAKRKHSDLRHIGLLSRGRDSLSKKRINRLFHSWKAVAVRSMVCTLRIARVQTRIQNLIVLRIFSDWCENVMCTQSRKRLIAWTNRCRCRQIVLTVISEWSATVRFKFSLKQRLSRTLSQPSRLLLMVFCDWLAAASLKAFRRTCLSSRFLNFVLQLSRKIFGEWSVAVLRQVSRRNRTSLGIRILLAKAFCGWSVAALQKAFRRTRLSSKVRTFEVRISRRMFVEWSVAVLRQVSRRNQLSSGIRIFLKKVLCEWSVATLQKALRRTCLSLKARTFAIRISRKMFGAWTIAVLQQVSHRNRLSFGIRIFLARRTHRGFFEWLAIVLYKQSKKRSLLQAFNLLVKSRTSRILATWVNVSQIDHCLRRRLSRAQKCLQRSRVSLSFGRWAYRSLGDHFKKKLFAVTQYNRVTLRSWSLASALIVSWVEIIVLRKLREKKVVRKLFSKSKSLKLEVFQHLHVFCARKTLTNRQTLGKIAKIERQLCYSGLFAFLGILTVNHQNHLDVCKNLMNKVVHVWKYYVRSQKWRRHIVRFLATKRAYAYVDAGFGVWIHSLKMDHQGDELYSLSANKWRLHVLAKTFDMWKRIGELTIRRYAYVFLETIFANKTRVERSIYLRSHLRVWEKWASHRSHLQTVQRTYRRLLQRRRLTKVLRHLFVYCCQKYFLRSRYAQFRSCKGKQSKRSIMLAWADVCNQSLPSWKAVEVLCARAHEWRANELIKITFSLWSQASSLTHIVRGSCKKFLKSKFRPWRILANFKASLYKRFKLYNLSKGLLSHRVTCNQILSSWRKVSTRSGCLRKANNKALLRQQVYLKGWVLETWYSYFLASKRLRNLLIKGQSRNKCRSIASKFDIWRICARAGEMGLCISGRRRNVQYLSSDSIERGQSPSFNGLREGDPKCLRSNVSSWMMLMENTEGRNDKTVLLMLLRWRQLLDVKHTFLRHAGRFGSLIFGAWVFCTKRSQKLSLHIHRKYFARRNQVMLRYFSVLQKIQKCQPRLDALLIKFRRCQQDKMNCAIFHGWYEYTSGEKRLRSLLAKASKFAIIPVPVTLELVLEMRMSEIAENEDAFKDSVVRDVAEAVGGRAGMIHCARLQAGSIIVHLKLEEGVCGIHRSAQAVAKELVAQAMMPDSRLKNGRYTCNAKEAKITCSSTLDKDKTIEKHRASIAAFLRWHAYSSQKSRHKKAIRMRTSGFMFKLVSFFFSAWCAVQCENTINSLTHRLNSTQSLHEVLSRDQDQVVIGAMRLKQKCDLQVQEVDRLNRVISSLESDNSAILTNVGQERTEWASEGNKRESELQDEREFFKSEMYAERLRSKQRGIDKFEGIGNVGRARNMQQRAFYCLWCYTRQQSRLERFHRDRKLRFMSLVFHSFFVLSAQERQTEMLQYVESSFSMIRDSLTEAKRVGTNMLEEHAQPDVMVHTPRNRAVPPVSERPTVSERPPVPRTQGSSTQRRALRYKEIVPLPPKDGRGFHISGRRFFVRDMEKGPFESSIHSELVLTAKGVTSMILELSERDRARSENRSHRDSAWIIWKKRSDILMADVRLRSWTKCSLQHHFASWQSLTQYHRDMAHFEKQCQSRRVAKHSKRILDVFSMHRVEAKMKNIENEFHEVNSELNSLQSGISNLKEQACITHTMSDGESNPQRWRLDSEKINPHGDCLHDETAGTQSSDALHDLAEVMDSVSRLRSLNTILQDKSDEQEHLLQDLRKYVDQTALKEAEIVRSARHFDAQTSETLQVLENILLDLQPHLSNFIPSAIRDLQMSKESLVLDQRSCRQQLCESENKVVTITEFARVLDGDLNTASLLLSDVLKTEADVTQDRNILNKKEAELRKTRQQLMDAQAKCEMLESGVKHEVAEENNGKNGQSGIIEMLKKEMVDVKAAHSKQVLEIHISMKDKIVGVEYVCKDLDQCLAATLLELTQILDSQSQQTMQERGMQEFDVPRQQTELDPAIPDLQEQIVDVHAVHGKDAKEPRAVRENEEEIEVALLDVQAAHEMELSKLRQSGELHDVIVSRLQATHFFVDKSSKSITMLESNVETLAFAVRCGVEQLWLLRGDFLKLTHENQALKSECSRLKGFENGVAAVRARVDDLQTKEERASKSIVSLQTVKRNLELQLQQSQDTIKKLETEKLEVETSTVSLLETLTSTVSLLENENQGCVARVDAIKEDAQNAAYEFAQLLESIEDCVRTIEPSISDIIPSALNVLISISDDKGMRVQELSDKLLVKEGRLQAASNLTESLALELNVASTHLTEEIANLHMRVTEGLESHMQEMRVLKEKTDQDAIEKQVAHHMELQGCQAAESSSSERIQQFAASLATTDAAIRTGLERVVAMRGHVMSLQTDKQAFKAECARLRGLEASLTTFQSRVSDMQSREDVAHKNTLALQTTKRAVERQLSEANESIRKHKVGTKHLTQEKVDLESEIEALKLVNARLKTHSMREAADELAGETIFFLQSEKRHLEMQLAELQAALWRSTPGIKLLQTETPSLQSLSQAVHVVKLELAQRVDPQEQEDSSKLHNKVETSDTCAQALKQGSPDTEANAMYDQGQDGSNVSTTSSNVSTTSPVTTNPVTLSMSPRKLIGVGQDPSDSAAMGSDRGMLLAAVQELRDSLTQRARKSRPSTPRLGAIDPGEPAEVMAAIGMDLSAVEHDTTFHADDTMSWAIDIQHLHRSQVNEEVPDEMQRAIRAANKLRASPTIREHTKFSPTLTCSFSTKSHNNLSSERHPVQKTHTDTPTAHSNLAAHAADEEADAFNQRQRATAVAAASRARVSAAYNTALSCTSPSNAALSEPAHAASAAADALHAKAVAAAARTRARQTGPTKTGATDEKTRLLLCAAAAQASVSESIFQSSLVSFSVASEEQGDERAEEDRWGGRGQQMEWAPVLAATSVQERLREEEIIQQAAADSKKSDALFAAARARAQIDERERT